MARPLLLLLALSMLLLGASAAVAPREDGPARAWRELPVKTPAPAIGILSQICHTCPGKSYISAAFVKLVEMAGARAVPIRFYRSEAELRRIFKSVNGIIFPGGLTDIWLDDPYTVAARKLWTWAKQSTDKGEPYPIFGVCLGFQLLHVLEANVSFPEILVETDAVGYPSSVKFTPDGTKSELFGTMDPVLIGELEDEKRNIVMENHEFGLPPERYKQFPALGKGFHSLNTALDRDGVEYVATAEHWKYPFFGTQWHPEKPPFEFGMPDVPHTLEAIRVAQHMSNVFVEIARRNSHGFESREEEIDSMIYNWCPAYTLEDQNFDPTYDGPDATYFFDSQNEPPHEGPGRPGGGGGSREGDKERERLLAKQREMVRAQMVKEGRPVKQRKAGKVTKQGA
ncbi:class I glutamine amidotransferase-like protein [Hyaloraphidium curvatum]|nr:class I glutamine amidotransferase-like protein [Hyaloraphidium curvatum]